MAFEMETVTQVAALAVISAICAAVVKKQLPDMALVLTLGGVTLILLLALGAFRPIRELLDVLADRAGLSPAVLSPVIKTVGVALLTRVSAELCRDAGENGLASAVEIAGGACALLVCLPLFEAVVQMILDLL